MQFRPSFAQRVKVEAHRAWKREHGEGADGGPKYVPPFMSPKGARPDTFVGYNLWAIAQMEPGSTVRIVEGCKDTLAFLTKGVAAYGIPGTGVMPPETALEVLRERKVIVRLDGDKAGNEARQKIVDYLVANGVTAKPAVNVPEGLDVADLLVREHASTGCPCVTCTEWRASHPE
jgi:5S rRNA maturation endonuclease (ribonuclease M5)